MNNMRLFQVRFPDGSVHFIQGYHPDLKPGSVIDAKVDFGGIVKSLELLVMGVVVSMQLKGLDEAH